MRVWNVKTTQCLIRMLLVLILLGATGIANAGNAEWSGFMSVIGGVTMENGESFLATGKGNGKYQNEWSFSAESLIGIQVNYDIADNFHTAVQTIGRSSKGFDAELNMAEVSYDLNTKMRVSAGLFQPPTYYYSDYLDIKYAYHWIRPPMELYSGGNALTGVKFNYRDMIGDYNVQMQLVTGDIKFESESLSSQLSDSVYYYMTDYGIAGVISRDWAELRAVYALFDSSVKGDTIGMISDFKMNYWGVGLKFDWSWLFIVSEIAGYTADKVLNDVFNWYCSVGFRYDKFTPHVTYGKTEADDNNSSRQTKLNSFTAGIRYDVVPNAALKLEYSNREDDSINSTTDNTADVINLGLDVVF